MAINKTSNEVKSAIIRKSVKSLPNNPSREGYGPSDIKKAMYDFVTGDTYSVMSELDRIVDEINDTNKRLSFETTDWEEYLTGAYRLTITQATHGLANAYVAEMEIYNSDDSSWENNLAAVQKRLANDSVVIYSDKAVKCNLTIKGDK